MRRLKPSLSALALAAALLVAPPPPPAAAGEERPPALSALGATDPCGFFRGQAYGRGLDHFLTEMLWACEAIATRRGAGMPLGDRLLAADGALERYREAVVAAGAADFARARSTGPGARLGAADAVKSTLAAQTGTLTALDAIRSGF